MPLTLISTAGSTTANSYVSLLEANTYVETYVLASNRRELWDTTDWEDLERSLIIATRNLDDMFCWGGRKTYSSGALDWPRQFIYDELGNQYAQDEIPRAIKDATIEYALWLLDNSDDFPKTESFQYDSITVGPIKIDYNEKAGGLRERYIPDIITSLLNNFGEYIPVGMQSSNAIKVARLYRS